jgi:hypothetical protein
MTFDKRFYGIYLGICVNNEDPEDNQRIQLMVPQVLGQEITEWADPCMPVMFNANHPDHKKHLASEVAALLQAHANHTDTLSTASGGSPAHTHSITLNLAHTNNHTGKTPDSTFQLDHEHETAVNKPNKWNESSGDAFNDSTDTKEHTSHRGVPNLDQKVWVMFIAGDPNFPVWMGVLP